MNIDEATKILADHAIKVDRISKNKFRLWKKGGAVWESFASYEKNRKEEGWTGRQVIKLARAYSGDPGNTKIKKQLKSGDKVNRTLERDLIKTEQFDKIPSNSKIFTDDVWNYD